ncbi:MAG TPA: type II secretion system F family protein [Candidatus Ozemobacteraceae bacterium]|nr:type II secretion system F family protein [Candidatus Ozemobacteraceae bacterium]
MAEEAKKQEKRRPISDGPGEQKRPILSYLNPFYNMISLSEILIFTKYFSTLIKAGIPVLRCLSTLSRQMSTWRFKNTIWTMRNEVEGGIPLHATFKKNEDIFGLLYVNLVRVGEESGRLFNCLDRLGHLLDRELKLRRKVLSAMTYPAIISIVAIGVVTFLMVVVIPQFSKLFSQFGQELPYPTQVVINISNFIKDNILNLIAGSIGFLLVLYQVNQTEGGRNFFDNLKLKIPLFGTLTQKYNIALFARNLSTLFQSGVPIISGMKISIEVVENVVIAQALQKVVREVEGGTPIARALERVEIMPELSTQMIEIGEESGNLDEMLERVAEFYEDEINFLIDQMAALIEPAFIVVLGTIVGGIVLAMYLPIFRMARVVSGGGGGGMAGGGAP